MTQIDISKCFDSIYTHSFPWAVIGKSQTKFHLDESKATFAGRFDNVMQSLNHKETNGIVIGPEFSRVFAEVILQSVDQELQRRLLHSARLKHKIDYEIFRYVDDYFVFYNEISTQMKVLEALQDVLKTKKLSINPAKIKTYEKPIITEITIAKEKISSLMNGEIEPCCHDVDDAGTTRVDLSCQINSNRLIIKYKAVIKETKVTYNDLLNYTLSIIENKLTTLIESYKKCGQSSRDKKRLASALLGITEFAFFAYSASPRVNHTIRICRAVVTAVDFLNGIYFPRDLKHSFFKYIHDNVLQQLDKNAVVANREVESQYLLIALVGVGREYWLPEATLLKHFGIKYDATGNEYSREDFLSHFSITVLLSYIRDKIRYNRLRNFLEDHTILKLSFMKTHCANDTEALILLLDLLVCPFLSEGAKISIANVFGLDAADVASIQVTNDQWFTAWGSKFNLGKELDAKRSREVY